MKKFLLSLILLTALTVVAQTGPVMPTPSGGIDAVDIVPHTGTTTTHGNHTITGALTVGSSTGSSYVVSFNTRTGAVTPAAGDYTGITTTFWAMGPNPNALTSSMPIFGPMPTPVAFTVPPNGTNAQGTSQFYLGTLPTATWTATLYKVAGGTSGCTGSSTSLGTVAIATSGAQTWSTSSTSFSVGDCLEVVAPSSVDASAANPTLSLVVVK